MQQPVVQGEDAARHWFPVVIGVITLVVTAAVTYSQEILTPWGNALAAGAAATMTGALAYALFPSAARGAGLSVVVVAGALLALTFWQFRDDAPPGVTGFVGGCEPFTVHAQNRYPPSGAAVRAAPLRSADQVGSYAGNELITLDGWVRTQVAYPTNSPPFDSDVWFHLADDSGWVSYAGVRADPTVFDPTGLAEDGGRAVPTDERCSGSARM